MITRKPSKMEIEHILDWKLALVVAKDFERVLIGPEDEIKCRLEGQENVSLFYDQTRPFGTLLLSFDEDSDAAWNTAISKLYEAQELMHSYELRRQSAIVPEGEAKTIFTEKYDSGDPISQFVALRIWYGYWAHRGKPSPARCIHHLDAMQNLIRPFGYPCSLAGEQVRITDSNPIFRKTRELYACDREQYIYQISNGSGQDCVIIDESLIPLERYYLSKFAIWRKYLIRCKFCNRAFIANSRKYELCSDECRNQARVTNLTARAHDEDVSEIDRICINASAHWYNRLKKMKKSAEYTQEEIQMYTLAKARFLKEKTQKRKEHKKGNISYAELQTWLFKQEVEAQAALESIDVKRKESLETD